MGWQVRFLGGGVPANLHVQYGHSNPPEGADIRRLTAIGRIVKLAAPYTPFEAGVELDGVEADFVERQGETDHGLSFILGYGGGICPLAEGDYVALGMGWTGDIVAPIVEKFRGQVVEVAHNHSTLETDTWGIRCDSLLVLAQVAYADGDATTQEARILERAPSTGANKQQAVSGPLVTRGVDAPSSRKVIQELMPGEMILAYEAEDFPLRKLDTNGRSRLNIMRDAAHYSSARLYANGLDLVVRQFSAAADHVNHLYTDDDMFELAPEVDERPALAQVNVSSDAETADDFSALDGLSNAAAYSSGGDGDVSGAERWPNQQREQSLKAGGAAPISVESWSFVWEPEPGQEYSVMEPEPLYIPMHKATYELLRDFPEIMSVEPPNLEIRVERVRNARGLGLGYNNIDDVAYFVVPLNYIELDASKWYEVDSLGNRIYKLRGRIFDFADFINPDNSEAWPDRIGIPGIDVTLIGQTTGATYTATTDLNGYFLVRDVALDDYAVDATDPVIPPRYYGNLADNDPTNNTVIALKSAVNALDMTLGGANYQLQETPVVISVLKGALDYTATSDQEDYTGIEANYSRSVDVTYSDPAATGKAISIVDENFVSDMSALAKAEEMVGESQEAASTYTVVAVGNPLLAVGHVIRIVSSVMGISGTFRVDSLDREFAPEIGMWLDCIRGIRQDEIDALHESFVSKASFNALMAAQRKNNRIIARNLMRLAGIGSWQSQLPKGNGL